MDQGPEAIVILVFPGADEYDEIGDMCLAAHRALADEGSPLPRQFHSSVLIAEPSLAI